MKHAKKFALLSLLVVSCNSAAQNEPPSFDTPEAKALAVHLGPNTGHWERLKAVASTAKAGHSMLDEISDPTARAKAKEKWDLEVRRSLGAAAPANFHAEAQRVLVGQGALSSEPAAQGAR